MKALCVSIEDSTGLGRLFDMDVLAPDGRKLDREEVGGGSRKGQSCGTGKKGEKVHIPVAAVVCPIYEARLGRDADLF